MSNSIVRRYLFLVAISQLGLSFIMGYYVAFLRSFNLDPLQVNMVNFAFFGGMLLFEIPTGAIADVFGRRWSLVISCLIRSVAMFGYGVSHSFTGFLVFEIVDALGCTFAHGALIAWLKDRLASSDSEADLHPIMVKKSQIGCLLSIPACITGAKLAALNPQIPWLLAGFTLLAASIVIFFAMKEGKYVRHKQTILSKCQDCQLMITQSIRYASGSKAIRFIFALSILQCVAISAPNMQWQPLFEEVIGIKVGELGYLWAAISITLLIGNALSRHFLRIIGHEKHALVASQVLIGSGICLSVLIFNRFLLFPAFFIYEIGYAFFGPIKESYLQSQITDDKKRATITSCESTSMHLGAMIGLFVSGVIAKTISLQAAWLVFGSLLILGTLLVSRNGKH